MPSISALIVGYHAYDELRACLASLERYEPDAQIVVVDHDCDRDAGERLVNAHPRLVYLPRRENPGFAAGINQAATHASGSLFLIMNPDVQLRAQTVRSLRTWFDRRDDLGIVGGRVREGDGSIQPSARRFPDLSTAFGGRTSWLTRVAPGNPLTRRNLSASATETAQASEVDWVTGACMMVRADVFRQLGGFDERFFMYWEDSDLCLRARQAGWKTLYEPAAEVVHLTGRSSRHAPFRTLVAFHVSAFRHYWKHGSFLARVLSPVVAAGLMGRLVMRLLSRRDVNVATSDAGGR
jgi:GT2 family glycosyltransferase